MDMQKIWFAVVTLLSVYMQKRPRSTDKMLSDCDEGSSAGRPTVTWEVPARQRFDL